MRPAPVNPIYVSPLYCFLVMSLSTKYMAEARRLATKHLPASWDKDAVIYWLSRTKSEIWKKQPSCHRVWIMFRDELRVVMAWIADDEKETAWHRVRKNWKVLRTSDY